MCTEEWGPNDLDHLAANMSWQLLGSRFFFSHCFYQRIPLPQQPQSVSLAPPSIYGALAADHRPTHSISLELLGNSGLSDAYGLVTAAGYAVHKATPDSPSCREKQILKTKRSNSDPRGSVTRLTECSHGHRSSCLSLLFGTINRPDPIIQYTNCLKNET